jgi:restriction system protein
MKAADPTIWGIHAGKFGEADDLFKKKGLVALSWNEMGDLSSLASRDEFRHRYEQIYPGSKPMNVANCAGQLYRFARETQSGDLVAYPSRASREVWFGRVKGAYAYRPDLDANYPKTRAVEWLKHLPRTSFSQGALWEMGAAMSVFQVSKHAEEVLAAIQGKETVEPPQPEEEDAAVALVPEDIENQTRDFVLKRLATQLKGHAPAGLVEDILRAMGYKTRLNPPGPDAGVDIVAHPDELGFQAPRIKVQVKSGLGAVGGPDVKQLYGVLAAQESALFVALGTFTPQAKGFAAGKSNFRLVDGVELVELIYRYYDQLDGRYKAVIPLKRAFIPEVLGE